jgi:hypothetical protein
VFREIAITRAISAIGICPGRRSRRISDQSSTLSTCSLPGSAGARLSGKVVKIRLPRRGQYSASADSAEFFAQSFHDRALVQGHGSRRESVDAMSQPVLEGVTHCVASPQT